jgi:hypothetical protein
MLCLSVLFLTASVIRADEPKPAPAPPDASGCWSGYWISCTSGHKGPLSAKICKVGDNCYEAHFRGRFALVVPFRYKATMEVTGQDGDKLLLTSSRRLPLMGKFEMNATVTATDFVAEYTSRDDRGQFIMKRE